MKNLPQIFFGAIVMVLFTVGCQSTKIILPERFPASKPKCIGFIPVNLTDTSCFTLEKIKSKYGGEIIFSSPELNDENFNATISKGGAWFAFIFRIQSIMSSEEISAFMKEYHGLSPNAQGLMLVWEQGKEELTRALEKEKRDFPSKEEKYVIGFADNPKELWEGYGKSHGVACLSKCGEKWLLDMGCYERNWYQNYYIMFFVPEEIFFETLKSLPK
jgi:hypothetical protein